MTDRLVPVVGCETATRWGAARVYLGADSELPRKFSCLLTRLGKEEQCALCDTKKWRGSGRARAQQASHHKPSSLCLRLDFMYSTMHLRVVSPYRHETVPRGLPALTTGSG